VNPLDRVNALLARKGKQLALTILALPAAAVPAQVSPIVVHTLCATRLQQRLSQPWEVASSLLPQPRTAAGRPALARPEPLRA